MLEKVSRSVVNVSTIKLLHHIFYRAIPVKGMGSGTIIAPEGMHEGVVAGDLILEFAGAPTNSMEELVRKIQERKAEEKVEILILRNSKRRIVESILERTP